MVLAVGCGVMVPAGWLLLLLSYVGASWRAEQEQAHQGELEEPLRGELLEELEGGVSGEELERAKRGFYT